MQPIHFDNTFVRDLPGDPQDGPIVRQVHGALYSRIEPTPVMAPHLLAHSCEVARMIGIPEDDVRSSMFTSVFSGNGLLQGMQPYAMNYGGHQFGHWAGQLGDGRAITLGEAVNAAGERWELQLKGAGPTPYSRNADGRAVLRSSIREFLCSEAMHHLGIPTTRALSLVATGEQVLRDMFYDGHTKPEPGAVVCRAAPSFIRFGSFELPAARGDTTLLKRLVDFTIRRDFPDLAEEKKTLPDEALYARWFAQVCERTAIMVAHWMRVGFVHGVMNTDNMSILGLTLDYGPYGWIDNFDLDWTPNTIDAANRRYRFGQQPQIAYWNLCRLANALASLFTDIEPLHSGLKHYSDSYTMAYRNNIAAKLGLRECGDEDLVLMEDLQALMQSAEIDMTLFFRALADVDVRTPTLEPFNDVFYDPVKRGKAQSELIAWLALYGTRTRRDEMPADDRRARMNEANPCYVLRNYLAQEAIDRAEQGDASGIDELLDVLRRPYEEQAGCEHFVKRRPDWARNRAGCSMLSCSS